MIKSDNARRQINFQQSPRSCHYLEQPDIEVDEVVVISLQAELPNEFGKVVISDRSTMLLSQHREHKGNVGECVELGLERSASLMTSEKSKVISNALQQCSSP